MKRRILMDIAELFALISVFSCSDPSRLPEGPSPAAHRIDLNIGAGMPSTKAASSIVQDSAIDSIQVFIYSSDGVLENVRRAVGSSTEISCLAGEKLIWVLVNGPAVALEPGSRESDLLTYPLFLEDNHINSLLMAGSVRKDIARSETFLVSVDRLPSKVVFGSLKVNFEGTSLEGRSFVVKDVYLRNVAGQYNIDGTYVAGASSHWLNKFVNEDESARALLSDIGLNRTCAENTPESFDRTYFVFPNPTAEDDESPVWSPRRTHLVVHASIDGADCWYPFVLPVLERNRIYNVKSVTITMTGNPNPEDPPISTIPMGINITINPWTGEDEITYTF